MHGCFLRITHSACKQQGPSTVIRDQYGFCSIPHPLDGVLVCHRITFSVIAADLIVGQRVYKLIKKAIRTFKIGKDVRNSSCQEVLLSRTEVRAGDRNSVLWQ